MKCDGRERRKVKVFFYMPGLFTFKFSFNLINLQVSYPIFQMKRLRLGERNQLERGAFPEGRDGKS